jgi:hypothetical protein
LDKIINLIQDIWSEEKNNCVFELKRADADDCKDLLDIYYENSASIFNVNIKTIISIIVDKLIPYDQHIKPSTNNIEITPNKKHKAVDDAK